MFRLCIGFIAGVCLLLWLPAIPPIWLLATACILALPLRTALLLGLAAGCLWAAVTAERELHRWPSAESEPITVSARVRIADIPRQGEYGVTLTLRILDSDPHLEARRVHVFWPSPPVLPRAGETWKLPLRLSRPSGFRNVQGVDRERWALSARIHARGQVMPGAGANRIAPPVGVQALRQQLAEGILEAVPDANAAALAVALVVGDRQHLSDGLWHQLIATGTNHLVAISGLHVSLLAGAVWLLASAGWRAVPALCRHYPARLAGAWPALAAAAVYAMLAGFALPTQRALLMLAVLILVLLARRSLAPGQALISAVACMLVLDPLAPLAPTFWLSTVAVAVLVVAALGSSARPIGTWVRAQFALLVGLLPLTVYWFDQAVWIAPLANLAAVPLVGALVVPVLLLGAVVSPAAEGVAAFLWAWGGWLLEGLDWLTWQLTRVPGLYRTLEPAPAWLALTATLGAALLLMPRGFPGRILAPMLIVPLLLPVASGVPKGQAEIRLYDVGHGQAMRITTRSQVIVLDSGPERPGRDLLPRGGMPMLSYSRDRAGYRGAYDGAGLEPVHLCTLPERKQVDGVGLSRISHAAGCLLLIEAGDERLLVLSGLERPPRQSSVQAFGALPPIRFLVAAAHGHAGYHPPKLLDSLSPDHVLVSVNAGNRWGLPHDAFRREVESRGARLWVTGCSGELRVLLGRDAGVRTPASERHWWRRGAPAGCQ